MPKNQTPVDDSVPLDELTEAQREATLRAARSALAVLDEPDPGDPHDFDYKQRLFGAEGRYEGELPAQIPRAAVTSWLSALARTGSYTAAAAHTMYSASKWQSIRRIDQERNDGEGGDFTAVAANALEVHAEALYEAAHSIAFHGSHEVVFHGGVAVGMKRSRNARLIELILKKKHPDFREEKLSEVAKAGGVLVVTGTMSRDDWDNQHGDKE